MNKSHHTRICIRRYPGRSVCCSVLQCVAVCCSVLRCVAVCYSVLQCAAMCCSVYAGNRVDHAALYLRIHMCVPRCTLLAYTLQHTATHCNTLQHTATHCNTLQHAVAHRNTLQHTLPACTYVCPGYLRQGGYHIIICRYNALTRLPAQV